MKEKNIRLIRTLDEGMLLDSGKTELCENPCKRS